jgi:hypothetical protein
LPRQGTAQIRSANRFRTSIVESSKPVIRIQSIQDWNSSATVGANARRASSRASAIRRASAANRPASSPHRTGVIPSS